MGRELSLGAAEDGKKTRERTIWTEQTEDSVENKGVSASCGSRTTAIRGQKTLFRAKNMGKNRPYVGHWLKPGSGTSKIETGK
jgi:hypothetical protein